MGAVGVPVWLWVEDDWTSRTVKAEISSGSITATATPREVRWDMGDGTQVTCKQGSPYRESYGWAESPDCGHIYQETSADQPNQRYTLAADMIWEVEITGDQQFTFDLATRDVVFPAIGEYQSVVTDR